MKSRSLPSLQMTVMALLSAMTFVELFRLNNWLFAAWEHTQGVNWVFLPAGVRVLLVLALGLPGALGIVLGNLWLDRSQLDMPSLLPTVSIALASGIGPWLVKGFMERRGLLQRNLAHITSNRLLQYVLFYAAFNALTHQLIHWVSSTPNSVPWVDVWPMFIGDAIGALVLLYSMKLMLVSLRHCLRTPQS